MTNSTKNINKVYEEIKIGQQQLKFQIEDLKVKDSSTLGQNELKELIIKTTAYMSGKLSVSERMKLEIEWLNENERQELLNNINEKKWNLIVRDGRMIGMTIRIMITKV